MKIQTMQTGLYAVVFAVVAVQSHAATPVDFSNLVEQVSPAVVSVNVVKKMTQEELLQQQVPEILRRFFGNQVIIPQQQAKKKKTAYGSAFFISKRNKRFWGGEGSTQQFFQKRQERICGKIVVVGLCLFLINFLL